MFLKHKIEQTYPNIAIPDDAFEKIFKKRIITDNLYGVDIMEEATEIAKCGFDAIITNPPWEIFKPQAREFFVQHNDLVKKSKMNIKTFEEEQ